MSIEIFNDSPLIDVTLKLTDAGKKEIQLEATKLRLRADKLEACAHEIVLKGSRALCTICRFEWNI